MRKKMLFVLGLVFAVGVYALPSHAFEAGNNYMMFKPGIYSPQASRIDHFDDGFHGEIAFGYKYNPFFAGEMAVGYYHTEGSLRLGLSDGTTVREDYNIDVYPLTLTLKGGFPLDYLELYGLTGIGAHFVRGKFDDSVFGFHLGGGMLFHLSPAWFVGVEGKYLWTGKAELEDRVRGEKIRVKIPMDGILATAVVGFRF